MITINRQQGYLTIVTVILIAIMGFIAVAMAYVFSNSASSTNNYQEASSALYLADSALEQATRALLLPKVGSRVACSGLTITNSAVGDGIYTVTAAGPFDTPSHATTLNTALTATATTIPVVSTTGYQSSGRIMVDRELINYTAVDATDFLNATRGVDGSTAVIHALATPVGQYQCNLSATGGVPTITPANPGDPGGIRKLNENIQLQDSWAVGNKPGTNNFTFIRWNNPTELAWNNASVASASAVNLNSISMLSYADGWAVGANGTFMHWDGNTWTPQNPATVPNVTLQSIYCNSSNDCQAVGQKSGSSPAIAHWNGAIWTSFIPINASGNNLLSVRCDASNDCWAVGDNAGNKFYQWNGTTWITVIVGTLSGFTFNSVYCNSSTDCWAVGSNDIFARKNGTSWANASVTERGTIPSAIYNSVFCNSSADCWAVGNSNSAKDLFVHWNGTNWSRDTSNPTPVVNLNEVKCANTNDCWAVGAASGGQPTFVHWDGTSWTTFTVSGLPNVNLISLSMIMGPSSQPWSNWTENFS